MALFVFNCTQFVTFGLGTIRSERFKAKNGTEVHPKGTLMYFSWHITGIC